MTKTINKKRIDLDFGPQYAAALKFQRAHGRYPLRYLLISYRAYARKPLSPEYYDLTLDKLNIFSAHIPTGQGVDLTPNKPDDISGVRSLRSNLDDLFQQMQPPQPDSSENEPEETSYDDTLDPEDYAETISDREAVHTTYYHELEEVVRFLKNDLSVLIQCDKILTEHIYEFVCHRAGRKWILEDGSTATGPAKSLQQTNWQTDDTRQKFAQVLEANNAGRDPADILSRIIKALKEDEVLVLRSLDMLDAPPLIEILYQGSSNHRKPQLLAFIDPSLEVKQVILNRFAISLSIQGLPRHIQPDGENQPVHTVTRLITSSERQRFREFDPENLYKNVSGLNPVQFRDAMRYVGAVLVPGADVREIYDRIRYFKTATSSEIEIPNTKFEQIGGYESVKRELKRIIDLVAGRVSGISEQQREELVPRGFIFHGPPGTGKTLFAKAIANEMNATIQMVSGPEVMDKYVGQSESNLRQIFATARRNAPSVILFDEFDSLASQRSTYTDGGARANNAVVAQLLTELDGFRRDQMVMVIGTTNRLDIIDEALLRPSRLKPIEIGRPDTLARREVARIHAQNFGVSKILETLCRLTLNYLSDWETTNETDIPGDFLKALIAWHKPYATRYKIDAQQIQFKRELANLFQLLETAQTENPTSSDADESDSVLEQVQARLLEIAPGYDLDLIQPDPATAVPTVNRIQTDLIDLFRFVQQQKAEAGGQDDFSVQSFIDSVITLVAEYTEGFNNDEIRAIFQEASLEHHLEGQLITPRYLGMKIGIIRRRRDERTVVHLETDRGRH